VNEPADLQSGKYDPQAAFEIRLRSAAQAFPYPPAPDVSQAVRQRLFSRQQARPVRVRLAIAAIVLALIAAGLLAVPPVRAAILNWIRVGAVQIWFGPPSPTPTATARPGPTATFAPTDLPTPTPLSSILDLSGETSLDNARKLAGYKVDLPAFPTDLGLPQHVYFQDLGGPVVVLVWMEPDQPQSVRLVLSETDAHNIVFQKYDPVSVQHTQVNGQSAAWVDAPYMLLSGSGDSAFTRIIKQGHTLIWTAGRMTYRLETNMDLTTALRIAESLPVER
jgi:hypothetical protein